MRGAPHPTQPIVSYRPTQFIRDAFFRMTSAILLSR